MNKLRILLTGSGAPGWVSIYKCLKSTSNKFEIYGCDAVSNTAGSHFASKSFTVLMGNDPRYVDTLLALCLKEKINIILPITDAELLPLAQNIKLFQKHSIKIPISSYSSLRIATDKLLLFQFLRNNYLGNPKFILAKSWSEFLDAVRKLGYPNKPICFKPAVSWGSRGFRIVDQRINPFDLYLNQKPTSVYISIEEVERIFHHAKQFPPILVMEYLSGVEYTVDLFLSQKKALFVIPRRRIKTVGGITTEGVVENNKEIIELSKNIVQKLGLNYSVGLQLKYNEKGIPKVLEINPRLQGTSILSYAAGVNLAYLTILQCLNMNIPKENIAYGTYMYRFWEELFLNKKNKVLNLFHGH